VCVVLCAVFRLIVVLFCVMRVICVLCLIVVPLPPGENPFAVKINNNHFVLRHHIILSMDGVIKGTSNKKTKRRKKLRRFQKSKQAKI
jgi:hypothetical protein